MTEKYHPSSRNLQLHLIPFTSSLRTWTSERMNQNWQCSAECETLKWKIFWNLLCIAECLFLYCSMNNLDFVKRENCRFSVCFKPNFHWPQIECLPCFKVEDTDWTHPQKPGESQNRMNSSIVQTNTHVTLLYIALVFAAGGQTRCRSLYQGVNSIGLKTVGRPFRCLLRRIFMRISGVKYSWAPI